MTVDELLARARLALERVAPENLADEMARGAIIVDIRPQESRSQEGDLPGAVVIDRNVLEWRLAPSSLNKVIDVSGRRVVLVCNEGYSSSLAAEVLQQLGVEGATDLIGGFRAWKAVLGATLGDAT